MNSYRQGDVFLMPVETREKTGADACEHGRIILAHGEVTGHAHELVSADPTIAAPAQFFQEPGGRRFLFVEHPCVLVHPEHGPITVAPGCYEVRRQREYAPEEIRSLLD